MVLTTRINIWAIGGKRSHPFVSFSASRCAATTGRSASEFCKLVATSLKTPVRPVWSCGAVLADAGKLILDHQRNQTRAHFFRVNR